MDTAPYVFGSSPDSLAQQRGFYDNINLRLAEQDRDARQRAIDQQRENYIFAMKHADEQNRQNQELALRLADESYNRNLGASDRAFKMYQFGLNRGDQARQEAESNRRFGIEDAARTRGLDIQDDRLDLADKAQQDKLGAYSQQEAEYKKQQSEDMASALGRANIIVNASNQVPLPNSHLFGLYHTQEPRKILTEDEAFKLAMRDTSLLQHLDKFIWDTQNQKFMLKGQPQPQYQFAPTSGTNAAPMGNNLTSGLMTPSPARFDTNIDLSRPAISNPDGSFSTEKTITVGADGGYYLLPTIVGGRQLSNDEAIKAWKSGRNTPVGRFQSQQEADAAAVQRSQRIGDVRGSSYFAPSNAPAPMAVNPFPAPAPMPVGGGQSNGWWQQPQRASRPVDIQANVISSQPTPQRLMPNTKKEDLRVGQTYITSRGVATWDGEKFVQQ